MAQAASLGKMICKPAQRFSREEWFEIKGKLPDDRKVVRFYRCVETISQEEFLVKRVQLQDSDHHSKQDLNTWSQLRHAHILRYQDAWVSCEPLEVQHVLCETALCCLPVLLEKMLPDTPCQRLYPIWLYHIASALEYMHEQNNQDRPIIHRNLRPSSILVTAHCTLKLCDFEFSKRLEKPKGITSTVMGKDVFQSPEIRDGHPYGKSTDIWTFGVTAGHIADYGAAKKTATEEKIKRIVRESRHGSEVKGIVEACLQRSAEARPKASEIRASLEKMFDPAWVDGSHLPPAELFPAPLRGHSSSTGSAKPKANETNKPVPSRPPDDSAVVEKVKRPEATESSLPKMSHDSATKETQTSVNKSAGRSAPSREPVQTGKRATQTSIKEKQKIELKIAIHNIHPRRPLSSSVSEEDAHGELSQGTKVAVIVQGHEKRSSSRQLVSTDDTPNTTTNTADAERNKTQSHRRHEKTPKQNAAHRDRSTTESEPTAAHSEGTETHREKSQTQNNRTATHRDKTTHDDRTATRRDKTTHDDRTATRSSRTTAQDDRTATDDERTTATERTTTHNERTFTRNEVAAIPPYRRARPHISSAGQSEEQSSRAFSSQPSSSKADETSNESDVEWPETPELEQTYKKQLRLVRQLNNDFPLLQHLLKTPRREREELLKEKRYSTGAAKKILRDAELVEMLDSAVERAQPGPYGRTHVKRHAPDAFDPEALALFQQRRHQRPADRRGGNESRTPRPRARWSMQENTTDEDTSGLGDSLNSHPGT